MAGPRDGLRLAARELLREQVPAGDIHTDEERRLLYVAMTRAQERLILATHGGTGAKARPVRGGAADGRRLGDHAYRPRLRGDGRGRRGAGAR